MIDLHIHTTATPHHSGWEPDTLARYAAQHGYQWIAAADHNTTASVSALRAAADRYGVRTVSAVELDSAELGKLWHTLVYGADPQAPELLALCEEVTQRNTADSHHLLDLLPRLGFRLPARDNLPAVVNVAGIAALLAAHNVLPGRVDGEPDEEAGMRFLLTQLPEAYRPLPVRDIIEVAHRLGAYAVLAHPGRSKGIYAIPATDDEIAQLAGFGLDGIEVFYPTHDSETRARLWSAARQQQLYVSGGSDSHFPHQPLATLAARSDHVADGTAGMLVGSVMQRDFTAEIADLSRRYGVPRVESVHLDDCRFKPISSGRTAEVAMIIRRRNGLVLTARKRYYPRRIHRLLTGGIEGTESIEAALRRELYEETNLDTTINRFAAVLQYSRRTAPHDLVFQTFAFLLDDTGGILQNNDHDEQLEAFLEVPPQALSALGTQLSTLPVHYDREIGGTWQAWGAFRSPLHHTIAQIC